jgi:hypothetical protein
MASSFPGMDPYLEPFWRDVHASFIIYARDQLQAHLPGDLRARVEERVFVETEAGEEHSLYPDVRVVERGRGRSAATSSATTVAVAEPLILELSDEPVTETFIEIIDLGSQKRVVTVIEVLSLANKLPGPGQKLYRKKQRECKKARVSLVEIDLLRSGKRVLSVPLRRIPIAYRTTYQVCVRRGWRLGKAEIYRVPLRERLPIIKIPLRKTDADAPLDLQALIEQCYRHGGYDNDIDYKTELDPPLDKADKAWTEDRLRSLGSR